MKKQLMLGAIVASLALTGCNNFRLETSIPTFELSLVSYFAGLSGGDHRGH